MDKDRVGATVVAALNDVQRKVGGSQSGAARHI